MANKLTLCLAVEPYDRHFPFFDGTVSTPDDIDLKMLQVGQNVTLRDGIERHERMLKGEFDVAEFSISSYLIAKAQHVPIIGIPVFPRRLFSQSQMWVHQDSDLWHPKDLVGKKVALASFQTTLSVLAKGDMKFYYDVPWEEIHWLLTVEEPVRFNVNEGVLLGSRLRRTQGHQFLAAVAVVFAHSPHLTVVGRSSPLSHYRATTFTRVMESS